MISRRAFLSLLGLPLALQLAKKLPSQGTAVIKPAAAIPGARNITITFVGSGNYHLEDIRDLLRELNESS